MAGEMDRLKGTGNKVKGETEEFTGEMTGDRSMERQGKLDKLKGEAQKAWGDIKEKAEDIKRDIQR